MNTVTVVGAGSWGTALAMVLAANDNQVILHTINKSICEEVNKNHTNNKYLSGVTLSKNIKCVTEYEEAFVESNLVVIVVPSHAFRTVMNEMKPFLNSKMTLISATKGIENNSFLTMTQIMKEILPVEFHPNIVVLSGPSHAEEVSKEIPTTIVSSGENKESAQLVQKVFMNNYFRVYTNSDVIGVELAGALKNIIALGAGISDGLGLGDNGKAALLTRGLAEMTRLGLKLGARMETFAGLAGVGDLIVTGTSKHSRNWKTGNLLASGYTLEEALEKIGMVAEGVKTTKSAFGLAQSVGVDTPITNEIYKVLFENKNAKEATKELMTRMYKEEHY